MNTCNGNISEEKVVGVKFLAVSLSLSSILIYVIV